MFYLDHCHGQIFANHNYGMKLFVQQAKIVFEEIAYRGKIR